LQAAEFRDFFRGTNREVLFQRPSLVGILLALKEEKVDGRET